MSIPFDIFRTEATGCVLWLASAPTLDHAKNRAQEFAVDSPGEYILLNQITGDKCVIRFDEISQAFAA